MNKQSAFNQIFSEPVLMGGYGYALSAELYTREQAAAIFSDWTDEEVRQESLKEDAVRFSLPPEYCHYDGPRENLWWAGATGKGSKPIWWYGE